jgi:hypothetical protein
MPNISVIGVLIIFTSLPSDPTYVYPERKRKAIEPVGLPTFTFRQVGVRPIKFQALPGPQACFPTGKRVAKVRVDIGCGLSFLSRKNKIRA